MRKKILLFGLFGLLLSCGLDKQNEAKKIRLKIKGSDTVYPLSKLLCTSFQMQNKQSEIILEGGGTTAGFAAFIDGKADVVAASRDLKPVEKERLDSLKKEVLTYIIAFDGLAVIVNAANPIEKITKDQLTAIFQGKVTNWKELGGMREKIDVYALSKTNGVDEFFRDKIMGEDNYSSSVNRVEKAKDLVKRVANSKSAIGYCNLTLLQPKVKYLSVSYDSSKTFIAPNAFNFQNRSYPISRALYYFADASKEAEMKLFTDYTKTLLGKRNISEMGFIPPQ